MCEPHELDDKNDFGLVSAIGHARENLHWRPHRATTALPLSGWHALHGEPLPANSNDEANATCPTGLTGPNCDQIIVRIAVIESGQVHGDIREIPRQLTVREVPAEL